MNTSKQQFTLDQQNHLYRTKTYQRYVNERVILPFAIQNIEPKEHGFPIGP